MAAMLGPVEARTNVICRTLAESDSKVCLCGGSDPQLTQRVTKDGRILQVSLIVSPLVNETGETYAIAATERGGTL
jgi:hypothetical protein